MKVFLFIILVFVNIIVIGQVSKNNSCAIMNPFLGTTGAIEDVCGTYDGGFIYYYYIPSYAIERICDSGNKFVINDLTGVNPNNYSIEKHLSENTYHLIKVNKKNEISWWKCYNYTPYINSICPYGYHVMYETKEHSIIFSKNGLIALHDSVGNRKWIINFSIDSVPGVKMTPFYKSMIIRDIKECNDGSFIALLDNCFSILKISKEGKLLWLKSTIFDEFNAQSYINNCDTCLNFYLASYRFGGGEYIKTSQIFETDDGGYLMIGKNKYRCKSIIKKHKKGEKGYGKYWYNPNSSIQGEKAIQVYPDVVYEVDDCIYANVDCPEEKLCHPEGSTVLVKTDKNGNVLWEKYFGEYSWPDITYHSNLVKLPGGKWLVNIQDCDKMPNSGNADGFGGPGPEYYLLNNNGDIIGRPRFSDEFEENNRPLSIHPTKIELAPDNGFYLFSQGKVVKADSTYELKWGQFFGGMALDIGEYGILSDTGVVCSERGWFYKYDKYGHDFSDSVRVEVSIEDHGTELFLRSKDPKTPVCYLGKKTFYYKYIHFKIITNKKDAGILIVEPEDLATNKNYKRQFDACSVYIIASGDRVRLQNKCREYFKNHRITNKPGKDPYCLTLRGFNPGQYQFAINKNTFDLDNNIHLNSFIMDPENAVLFPNAFEFDNFYGFRNIYCIFLKDGKYVYKLLDRETGKVICSGYFEYFKKQ